MRRCIAYLFSALMLLSAATGAAAQGRVVRTGLYSSFKGVGMEVMTEPEGKMESFILSTDFGGTLIRDIHESAGLKFSWRMHYTFSQGRSERGLVYRLYAGPGLSAGYVRDYTTKNDRGFGFMTGICANEGILLTFDKRAVSIALEFSQDLGFHMTRRGEMNNLNMGLYKRGIYSGYFPEIKVFIDLGRRGVR